MEKYDFLLNPTLITILSVYFLIMISRAVYLIGNDDFPDIFSFILADPTIMMSSIFGLGPGMLFSLPFIAIGFVLLCVLIPLTIWWGVIAMFQVLAFVGEILLS